MASNKIIKLIFLSFLLLGLGILLTSCRLWTVVELDQNGDSEQNDMVHFKDQDINLEEYVDSIWGSEIIPYIDKNAVDINVVLEALEQGVDDAGAQYGLRESEEGTPWKFIVRGQGKVIAVNTESRNGTIDIDLEPYDQESELKIQIGPVIRGTSLRDSLDFISFDDFRNQIEYSEFSSALHDQMNEGVLNDLDFDNLKNREIDFTGVFTYESGEIILSPVQIDIMEEPNNER